MKLNIQKVGTSSMFFFFHNVSIFRPPTATASGANPQRTATNYVSPGA